MPLTSHSTGTSPPEGCESDGFAQGCNIRERDNLHVAVKVRVLEDDPGKFAPRASKEDTPRALNYRIVDHIPVGIVAGPAGCGDPPLRHRLSKLG